MKAVGLTPREATADLMRDVAAAGEAFVADGRQS
jgi:hypothetical protein